MGRPARLRGAAHRLACLAPLAAALVALLALALARPAQGATTAGSTSTTSSGPQLVTDVRAHQRGYRLTGIQVRAIASRNQTIRAELRRHPHLVAYVYTNGADRWQVSWFTRGHHQRELAQAFVWDPTGTVTEAWTGFQVAWTMARGYPGAFGRQLNAWYVWIPVCIAFVLPFLPLRPLRRPNLLHLDLLVLLSFSVSLAFFNHAKIGLSVPLAYPPLLYLLVRLLALAFGRGRPREPLRLLVPASWLAIAIVFLVGFRVGLNVTDSNVIDVGYAGVIGADKILHGKQIYGGWPSDNQYGDTYGPVNYYAYTPFRATLGWSGVWDDLPASHGAAIAFDLLTLLGLFLLGRRVRGPTLGIVLAYCWAAYPFSLYALSSNSNDSLVALLVIAALLVLGSAPARGVAGALAGLTKFAPLALAPLFMRGAGDERPPVRELAAYALTYVWTVAVVMAPVVLSGNLAKFWHDTIVYQQGRGSPFSVWGLWGGLGFEQHLAQGAAVALGLALAVLPRRRGLIEVSALAGAILIALELGVTHWFYLYIVWFFAPAIVALVAVWPIAEEVEAFAGERGAAGEPSLVPT